MQPWEIECLASHTKVPTASTKVSVLGHCSHRSGFPRRSQPGRGSKHWEWKQAEACQKCFHTEETGCKAWGAKLNRHTHKQPAPARPQCFSTAQGREKRNEIPIIPLASVQLEASAAEASQDSPASGQVRCQMGFWWKSGKERKQH